MRVAKIYRYSLPMDSGVILRDNRLKERQGFVLVLEDGERQGLGEIAPLPGFSHESLEDAGVQLQACAERWIAGHTISFDALHPSVAFGFSMAEWELSGRLPKAGNYQVAPLCTGDPDELLPKLNEMKGEKVAKIKVGLYEPIRDGMLVNLFLESIPDLNLRLDANQAWTPEKAKNFAKRIAPSLRQRIQFFEEPCQSPGDSLSFAIDTGIAIAWDETLQQAVKGSSFRLEDLTGAKTIIIKPTLIGSLQRCYTLIEKAKSLGIKTVISSSIESSLGLSQLARLAQYLTPESVPGLDTLNLFQAQLVFSWPESALPLLELESQELLWQSH